MGKTKRLSRAAVVRQLNEAWVAMLEENNLNPTADALQKLARTTNPRPETLFIGSMTVNVGWFLQDFGKNYVKSVRINSDNDLQIALRQIKEVGHQLPAVMRNALKQVQGTLPRRGGPGRQPKLRPNEANQICDQIALFIRQKDNLKQALQKVSELTPQLLGKKVSPRTLQKAWDKRGQSGVS